MGAPVWSLVSSICNSWALYCVGNCEETVVSWKISCKSHHHVALVQYVTDHIWLRSTPLSLHGPLAKESKVPFFSKLFSLSASGL